MGQQPRGADSIGGGTVGPLRVGQPVEVSAQDSNVLVRAIGEPKLTLAQKLAAFDPAVHGGELMATSPVGNEVA
jgi:antitoxin MazE